ncbi:MAG TPA: DUF4337 domain-containing protein [Allosphingosinicella sp.]|jgi:hypothetical protein
MDPADAAEMIGEVSEENGGQDAVNRFRGRAALLIALIAAVLAVGGLGGGNATDDMIINTIRASDTWAFFQAKNVRQTGYELAVERLEDELATATGAARAPIAARLAAYRTQIARYESEPDPAAPHDPTAGEGKRELSARARGFEAARETAMARDDNFDWAEVLLQIALVLGSVAILAINRAILVLSAVLGALGALLVANGFTLLVVLPF